MEKMPMRRRTRIVCISDTHNCTVKLPKGDVLIHAGDLTNQGSYSELSRSVKWLEEADFEAKIVIAGNHDITLDKDFFQQHGNYFHNENPQSPEDCLSLFSSSPSITYLNHESTKIRLTSPSGPHTAFTVFGSPYSPAHGLWAFGYPTPQHPVYGNLTDIWDQIPLETDIVVTHTPPKSHCDESPERRAIGCEALRRALWRVRPLIAICGHVHPSRGSERVVWDLSSQHTSFKEESVVQWQDPGEGNNKMSLIDLTGKKSPALANDGSYPGRFSSSLESVSGFPLAGSILDAQATGSRTAGLGGDASSPRSDQAALTGRMGRRETCVVNAAIMKSNWPHVGGKKFHKPIVVDINLPIWE
ncbi:Metallo-dependent phosphatase-like protein [Mariannaea sp. PMI_226]|nr:Metallo-dependent phosphatase-like protein [Mariannaea sp. PMI_226]